MRLSIQARWKLKLASAARHLWRGDASHPLCRGCTIQVDQPPVAVRFSWRFWARPRIRDCAETIISVVAAPCRIYAPTRSRCNSPHHSAAPHASHLSRCLPAKPHRSAKPRTQAQTTPPQPHAVPTQQSRQRWPQRPAQHERGAHDRPQQQPHPRHLPHSYPLPLPPQQLPPQRPPLPHLLLRDRRKAKW